MIGYGSLSWDVLLKKIFTPFGEILNPGRTLMIYLSMEKVMEVFWCREYMFLLATAAAATLLFLPSMERIRLSQSEGCKSCLVDSEIGRQ